jgi:CO dehydrogenase nickel-insertion accessory protein CooC1
MIKEQKNLAGKRIGIFGKGGSGKSTLTVLLSKAFVERGYKVCVLDADSTNLGLSQALGYKQTPTPLLDYFGGMVFSGGLVTCPVDDPTPLASAEISLEALPGEFYQRNEEGITLMTAGKIGNQGPGAGCDGPIAKIARDLKISMKTDRPITLIDFKAGFEDSARGAVTSLDWVIVVVDPTTAAVEMAVNMRDMVGQIKADVLPATAHLETDEMVFWANFHFTESRIKGVIFVLNNIYNQEIEGYLRRKLVERGIEPVGVIYHDDSISSSWLKGLPIEDTPVLSQVYKVIDELENSEKRMQVS